LHDTSIAILALPCNRALSLILYYFTNLSDVTFQGNTEIGSHKTGCVRWSLNTGLINMKCTAKGN